MKLTHLHAHTTFSFLDGYGTPEQIRDRLVELGHDACAITDHGNIIGHVPCYYAYKEAGINPILGCEFYVCDDLHGRDKLCAASTGTEGIPHITIMAQNQVGYANLLKMSKISSTEGFYFRPRIDLELIKRHQEGLIVLSGCPTGYPTRILRGEFSDGGDNYDRMLYHLHQMRNSIRNYYVEIVPQPGWDLSHKVAPLLWRAACQLGIPIVFTADAHFPSPKHYRYQDAMLAVGLRKTIDDPTREIKLPEYQYYCSAEELVERAQLVLPEVHRSQLEMCVNNSHLISQTCDVEIKKAKSVAFPDIPECYLGDSSQFLWAEIGRGFTARLNKGEIPAHKTQEYLDRAIHEYKVLNSKSFCDYILAIADLVTEMKKRDCLIMTRGSAGGCLLLWLLGASETDPIKYGLIFERFYDSTRPDPPDVDIDFEQNRRDEAIAYMYDKYGRDKCSQIAALSKLGPKGAVADACSALGIHRSEYGPLSEVMNDTDTDMDRQLASITDSRALKVLESYPNLADLIKGMVGQYRHSSVHAAGILISSDPLDDVIGVFESNGKMIAAVDKHGAAKLGFLKIDMLAVQALDIVAAAAKIVRGNVSWIYDVRPLDDPNVMQTAANKINGIFQLDGFAASRALSAIHPDSFEDIVAASVLCRPGAADSIPIYRKNKVDKSEFDKYLASMHHKVAEIVSSTYGVLMYQEQVMRIARDVAGLEEKYVHKLRKDVGNKLGLDPINGDAWRAEWKARFISGALSHAQMSESESDYWWRQIEHHGGYSFNRSHALTYGVIGYWMLYLKTYYPAAFYEAYLQFEDDDIVRKKLIMEFMSMGGTVKIIDHKLSRQGFTSDGVSTLVGGYSDLKFVGPASAEKIVAKAPFSSEQEMINALPKRTRDLIIGSGFLSTDVRCMDPRQLIAVAPWIPIPAMMAEDITIRNTYGYRTISELPQGNPSGNTQVFGYVTGTDFKKDSIQFTVEDETGIVNVRLAKKNVKASGEKYRTINVGDLVTVIGWWSGDGSIFVQGFTLMRGNNG